ncbi:DNA cytosine methyltransferase (plasmid) [Burkholderia vietnamiensis]|uniref:DNA cytosine methyltransferase n=1 Tax=Burkholderia vietnamiensis TaxID=60552 RepID=UPI00201A1174|nr:DNA cytosine methyltransferase [Burkholderia vietnamiensis]MCO1349984.1 DNA cytosine methyltransferase [Burkholderia vietnamiensis]MCO1432454.1 DNA cytosine methyltransferase [Burkholderia vietnamiensis]UQN47385.1 DNA cytosine methyltransferase [Burkholderia vietnamiensis]
MTKKNLKIQAVDLFCGVGGLSYGLASAGIDVRAGIDVDPACRFPYETNIKATFLEKNVRDITGDELRRLYSKGAIKLLAGCAPCQPFSTLAKGKKKKGDEKWGLLEEFGRLVEELNPELVTMENVPRVANHGPFKSFLATLRKCGFQYDWDRIKCADIGIPQTRSRFVLVASRIGDITLPIRKDPHVTVRDAIGHLPPLKAGQVFAGDPLHKARSLTEVNLQRIRASIPGGTWEDWPETLRAPCHMKDNGKSFRSVYARMAWDAPSPTITTQAHNFGTGRFGHPKQDRAISLREAALLQSFPIEYEFVPKGVDPSFSTVGRLIGNAVPPKLGEHVGKVLQKHIYSTQNR